MNSNRTVLKLYHSGGSGGVTGRQTDPNGPRQTAGLWHSGSENAALLPAWKHIALIQDVDRGFPVNARGAVFGQRVILVC